MKNSPLFESKDYCCGCGACKNACPTDGIQMEYDEYGCCYPVVNRDKCLDCNKCIQACSFRKQDVKVSTKEAYAAVSGNTDLKKSTSGGVFAGIAKKILESGGYVYGCCMEKEEGKLNPKHICISKLRDLYRLSGSKYVQSDTGYIYRDIKEKLSQGKPVLFSGTPCQVTGLYGYLQKKYENLYTIDILCQGTPGTGFFQDFIANIEKKYNVQVVDFRFRDKSCPIDKGASIQYLKKDKSLVKKYFRWERNSYLQMFYKNYSLRESCYSCPYVCEHRPGNITLGDFWNFGDEHPELLEENGGPVKIRDGISFVIINDDKGKELLENYGSNIHRWKSTFHKIAKHNGRLRHRAIRKPKRHVIFKLYISGGYEKLEKWYGKRIVAFLIGQFCWQHIPVGIKKFLLKIINR